MKNLRIETYRLGIILCIISLFIFPRLFRMVYIGELASFNLMFYLGLIIFLQSKKSKNPNEKSKNKILLSVIIFSILSVIVFISQSYSNFTEKIGYIIINCIPIFIINCLINYKNEKFKKYVNIWYNTLKIVGVLLVSSWLIDQLTNNSIQKFIVNLYKMPSLFGSLAGNRFVSIYGHPLFNAVLMFSLLLWTFVMKSKIEVKNYVIIIMIAIIGIAITGSKSVLVLAALLIIINLMNKENFKYIIPFIFVLIFLYKVGIFDVPLSRLASGLNSGNISTGRNIWIVKLRERGLLEFNLIYGHPLDKSIEGLIAALEYPILRWAYKTGIIFASILTYFYFILPLYEIIKNNKKNLRFIFSIILYMLAVNINDGITSNCDALIIYIMNLSLLNYAMSSNIEGDENEKKKNDKCYNTGL